MKPNLYICHTAYQVLVDLLRAGRCACENGPHTMVLSASVPDTAALAARLDAAGVVKTVIVDETKWPGTVTGPFAHQRAARAFEKLCGWKFDRAAYENVYIHNDWSVLGRYMQDCRAGYILCEDTFGSTLGPDQHLVTDQRAAADFAAKQRGKGYLYWGDSPWCVRIESEDAARCTLFPAARMVTDSKAILLESLTDAEKALVCRIFLTQPLPEDPYYVAVLTNIMEHPADVIDFSNQKVVTNAAREILLISRSPIPYPKGTLDFEYEKVTGIQLYSKQALKFYHETPKSILEKAEENDMMRFIENGHKVHAIVSPYKTVSVDTPKDLALVNEILKEKQHG